MASVVSIWKLNNTRHHRTSRMSHTVVCTEHIEQYNERVSEKVSEWIGKWVSK